ncbi:MAG: polysaccharide biosynthesis C-terminal domain-containing protein [Planctomycetota bacterium]|nr:polysaccharide biosynthesis C-terminal domain-containing protein [Planctomycetota bacterium]
MLTEALQRLARHSAIYAAGPALQKLVGFLLLPFVTATIGGAAQYGVVEMGGVTLAIAAQVLGVNLLHGMTRFHAEAKDVRERGEVVSTTLWILAVTTGAAAVLALLFPEIASLVLVGTRGETKAAMVVFAILFAQTVGQVGLRWLQANERSGTYVAITTGKTALEVGLKVALLLAGIGSLGALLSVLGGEAVVAVALTVVVAVKLGLRFSPAIAKRLALYSLPLIGSGLFMFVLHQADRWFVQRLHGEAAVGVYGVGYKLGAMGNAVVLEAFGLIWFPFVFAIASEDEARLVCRKVATYASAGFAFLTLGLALFADEIVRLMASAEYADAARTLPVIAFGYLFWALFQVLHTTFYLRKRTGHVAWLVGGAALLNLALNAILVPAHGGLGAAWATLASFAALAIATWITAERLWPVGFEAGRIAAPIGLAGALAWGATRVPADGPLFWTVGAKIVLLLAFPVVLVCGGFLDRAEKAKIKTLLADVRRPRSGAR